MTSPVQAPSLFSPLFSFSGTNSQSNPDEMVSSAPDGPSFVPVSASSPEPAIAPTDENRPAASAESVIPTNFNKGRRISVAGESLSPSSFSSNSWRPRTIPKTEEQSMRLNKIIAQNFLFRGLDDEALQTILNVLEEKRIAGNVTIIQQGDEGEKFYVIESGSVDYFVNGNKVSSGGPGGSFGELALMYNSPRAATVVSTTPCVLWVLDGTSFRRILMERTASKRAMYEQFLREVPVLQSLTDWHRAKIADALKAVTFEVGDVIVKEGDVGETFYLIEDGEAEVHKEGEGKVNDLVKGDYFGELALLNDAPRAATVTAKTKLKTVTLDKSGFQRLLGQVISKK
ncbi:cyclic nucleotide-binding-like protein [Lipomyces arxii]|uniref:cyclic nucleotide-binding-like protein n=1 Tax=Lipomyces arxii TaxID=56418 RepID=UPI0034CD559F